MLNLKFYLFVFGNILRFSNGVGSAKLQGVPYDVKAAMLVFAATAVKTLYLWCTCIRDPRFKI